MRTQPTVLEARNLKKVYRMGRVEVEVLKGVNLQVEGGEFMAVLGPSGSGKSTLLNLVGALDRPTSGQVFIEGTDVSTLDDNALAEIRLWKIGFVFQFFNLLPRLTALQNVELKLMLAGMSPELRRRQAAELLGLVGLGQRLGHRPSELSGGEQQRVAIARALAIDPKFVLLDEPTGNLDQKTGQEIVNVLQDLNEREGKTFVIITHEPKLGEVADRVVHLVDGRIVKETRA
jgi:putative ABC transport system ATP-binding protein